MKSKTTKFLEENVGGQFLDIGLGDEFLDFTPKPEATKATTTKNREASSNYKAFV